jgi:hypothetical protein
MPRTLGPFRFLLIAVAGWMNQPQQHAIEYLQEEKRILREQPGKSAASPHGRPASQSGGQSQGAREKDAGGIGDHCHAGDIACAGTGGSSRTSTTAVRVANPVGRRRRRRSKHWLSVSNPGHELARSTIANILKRNAIEPAPERVRKTTWKEFLTQHRDQIVAADFFSVEVRTRKGLERFPGSVFSRTVHPTRPVCRDLDANQRVVDEPDRPQSDGCRRRAAQGQTLPDS